MKKILTVVIVLAVLVGGWFLFRSRSPGTAAPEADEKPAAKVETTAVLDQPIAQTIEAFGVVAAAPSGDHVATAPFDVIVQQIFVGLGTPVAAGDVLMEVAPTPDMKLQIDTAQNALVAANKALASTRERFDLKLATTPDLQAAQQAADDARLKVESFQARGLGKDGKILATAPGVVSKLDLTSGSMAAAGTALVAVSTSGQFEARLGVEASDAATVAAGQPVVLESSNRTESEKVTTTVRTVGAALDPVTGAAEVRAAFPASAHLLLGEHVRATIEVQRKEHALVVPRSAVLTDDEKHVLYTIKDNKATKHEVALGLATDELYEVIDPKLHAGDLVVTLGNYELEDGMAVQPPEKPDEKSSAVKAESKPAGEPPATKPESKAPAAPAATKPASEAKS